jgi:hypothetical protein
VRHFASALRTLGDNGGSAALTLCAPKPKV